MKILIEATLLVGFLSVISASIVDKKTLIALCIISGSWFLLGNGPLEHYQENPFSDIDMY